MRKLAKNTSAGFTLLELSIVIIISGIIFVSLLAIAKTYIENIEQEKLTRVVDSAKTAITQYRSAFGAYPCPANAALPKTAANYGKADCTIVPVGGVLIGILPQDKQLSVLISNFETLQTNFMDPWDRPLIYAVTRTLTNSATFNPEQGKIDIKDELGQNTGGIKGDAHFVVLSYGKDATCPAAGSENENCNGDARFISSIRYDAPGALHFDDRIAFYVEHQASLWSDHLNSSFTTQGNAKNDNSGNIGIGTTLPAQKLNVVGDISVSTKVMAQKICDDGTTDCMKPETLYNVTCPCSGGLGTGTGPGSTCLSTDLYIKGISLNAANQLVPTCGPLTFTPPAATVNCPGGVLGIYTDGTINCAP
jgi:prepilin-type N-terminal cleavage/methylation domain-containing protein